MSDSGTDVSSAEDHHMRDTGEPFLTIGKMAKQYNMTFRTLRFYESLGLLHPKRQGTVRLYSLQDCQRLEMTLRGRMLGFSLAEIHNFIENRDSANAKTELEFLLGPEQIVAQIHFLERQRDELNKALDCLRNAYQKITEAAKAQPPEENCSTL